MGAIPPLPSRSRSVFRRTLRLSYLPLVVSALALALLASCAPPGTQPLETSTTPEGGRGITRVSAGAECNSRLDPGLSRLNWASVTYQLYTICYDERYIDDVAIVKEWIDAALALGRQKYGVARPTYRGRRLRTTVFMPPVPAKFTRQGRLAVRFDDRDGSVVRAELYYLTPSVWRGDRLGRLQIPVADYHPHYVMHEMAHVVQYSFPRDSKPPSWIIEGLAEYEGFFHTTEYNRTTAIDSLIRYVHKYDREKILCCLTLDAQPGIATSSIYAGGALIMLFLAERFGEGIHAELFTAPLAEVLEQRGTTVAETYRELRAWFEQRVQALGETPWQPRETPRTQLPETPRTQLPEIPPEDDRGTTRVPAGAECNSRIYSDLSRLDWASVTYQFYYDLLRRALQERCYHCKEVA